MEDRRAKHLEELEVNTEISIRELQIYYNITNVKDTELGTLYFAHKNGIRYNFTDNGTKPNHVRVVKKY